MRLKSWLNQRVREWINSSCKCAQTQSSCKITGYCYKRYVHICKWFDKITLMIFQVNCCSLFLLRVRRACRQFRGPNQPSSQHRDPSPRWLSPSPKAWALVPSPLPPRLFQPRSSTASRAKPRWDSNNSFYPCASEWMCSFCSSLWVIVFAVDCGLLVVWFLSVLIFPYVQIHNKKGQALLNHWTERLS